MPVCEVWIIYSSSRTLHCRAPPPLPRAILQLWFQRSEVEKQCNVVSAALAQLHWLEGVRVRSGLTAFPFFILFFFDCWTRPGWFGRSQDVLGRSWLSLKRRRTLEKSVHENRRGQGLIETHQRLICYDFYVHWRLSSTFYPTSWSSSYGHGRII